MVVLAWNFLCAKSVVPSMEFANCILRLLAVAAVVRDTGVAVEFRAPGEEGYLARFEPGGVFMYTGDWRIARLALTYGACQPTPTGWFVYFPAERGGGPTLL